MAREDIGERGQWLFSLLMTDLCGRDDPFFRPRFLGEKYPTFDYIVEVVDQPSFFFETGTFHPLDPVAVSDIVDRVKAWYQALSNQLLPA